MVSYNNVSAFIREMKELSKTVIDNKEKDTWLWIPSTFDPAKGASGYRTEENFVASYFLVLDFDGGDLTPEAFEDIFWRKAKRVIGIPSSSITPSTRRAENPNKFRVILPYKRPARSFEEHRAVYDYIVWRLEEAGYTEEVFGLDHLSKAANQPFWIPTINRAHPEFAFFRTFGTKSRDINRCALDPTLCPKGEPPTRSDGQRLGVRSNLAGAIKIAEQHLIGMHKVDITHSLSSRCCWPKLGWMSSR